MRLKSNGQKSVLLSLIIVATVILAGTSGAVAQGRYKTGDRVECDVNNTKSFVKGTIAPFWERDGYNGMPPESGKWYRVNIDSYGGTTYEVICKVENMRPLAAAAGAGGNQNNEAAGNQTPATNARTNQTQNDAQSLKYKPGDRVECDASGTNAWEKGTILPFEKNDRVDGASYRVRLDIYARKGIYLEGIFCQTQRIRPLAGAQPYQPEKTAVPVGRVTTDEAGTLSADRPILDCPVEQPKVKNGARPNAELLRKIIR